MRFPRYATNLLLYQHTCPLGFRAFATPREESWALMMAATSVEIHLKSDMASLAVSRSQGSTGRKLRRPIPEPAHVTAVKERPIHDFKGLTRGGRPLSRWKFPVAGTEP